MHKIYFGKRSIVICAPDDEALSDPNSVEFHLGDKLDIHALVRMFEVQEETGVDQLQLRRLICITDHCYFRDNRWHLKHTWWYDMLYTDPTNLTPQREEDITKAAWVAKSSLPPFLKNTYPSIVEVFREARI